MTLVAGLLVLIANIQDATAIAFKTTSGKPVSGVWIIGGNDTPTTLGLSDRDGVALIPDDAIDEQVIGVAPDWDVYEVGAAVLRGDRILVVNGDDVIRGSLRIASEGGMAKGVIMFLPEGQPRRLLDALGSRNDSPLSRLAASECYMRMSRPLSADNSFFIEGVTRGQTGVLALPSNLRAVNGSYSVRVRASQEVAVDVVVRPGVDGRVVDAATALPIGGAEVGATWSITLSDANGSSVYNASQSARCADDGSFFLPLDYLNIDYGAGVVRDLVMEAGGRLQDLCIKASSNGLLGESAFAACRVEDLKPITIELRPKRAVRVRVCDEAGNGVYGAIIIAGRRAIVGSTDEAGLATLADGACMSCVRVVANGYRTVESPLGDLGELNVVTMTRAPIWTFSGCRVSPPRYIAIRLAGAHFYQDSEIAEAVMDKAFIEGASVVATEYMGGEVTKRLRPNASSIRVSGLQMNHAYSIGVANDVDAPVEWKVTDTQSLVDVHFDCGKW